MKVGLDVTPAIVGITGIARYARMLWEQLAGNDAIEVRAFGVGRGNDPPLPLRRLPLPLRVVHPAWKYLGWPKAETLAGNVDLIHCLDLIPPPTDRPLVMTIHDMIPMTHPHLYPASARRRHQAQIAAASKARIVLSTCLATAEEISRVGGVPPDRIVVAPLGLRLPKEPSPPARSEDPYILAVGAVTPRKGYEVLAAAAAALGADCPPILIAGPDWWEADSVRRRVRELDTFGRIRFLGPVNDDALEELYRRATLVCHPSLAEGFGMVCLEAMGYGLPAISSDLACVREFAEGCIRFVAPSDPGELAQAFHELLSDDEERSSLGEKARARAQTYTWERTAECVVDAYRKALS